MVIGLLFIAGSFSAVTVPLAGSNLRLEMVAVPVLAAMLIWQQPRTLRELSGALKIPMALVGIYLLSHFASSLLFAPMPAESLKIALWLALSVAACFVAAALAWRRVPRINLGPWIVAGASIQVAVGLAAVFSQMVFATTWGVMARDTLLGKAIGLSWEANILSINVAMALPFLVWVAPEWTLPRIGRIALLAFLSLGLGLAFSRGGLLAFLVGAGSALALSYASTQTPTRGRQALSIVATMAAVLLLAVGTMQILDFAGERLAAARCVIVVKEGEVLVPQDGLACDPGQVAEHRVVGTGDTWEIRLRNMKTALAEVPESPIVGLGTDSYRQEHIEPTCACPAFINNLTVATLYESGVVGLLALAGFVACVLLIAWRNRAWAHLAAVVAMVVGFQFTDAMRFESNWILMGVVLGLTSLAGHDPPG